MFNLMYWFAITISLIAMFGSAIGVATGLVALEILRYGGFTLRLDTRRLSACVAGAWSLVLMLTVLLLPFEAVGRGHAMVAAVLSWIALVVHTSVYWRLASRPPDRVRVRIPS